MILRRLTDALRKQDWFTVVIETLIVVLGVFLGLQVNNWNEARAAESRRAEIIRALATDLRDAIYVQEQLQVSVIDTGLTVWHAAYERGEQPVPFYFRIDGSDKAPLTWTVLQQMDIAGLFDPVMLFDLNFYYSELDGVGEKYVRYVTFVETEILPYEKSDSMHFYTPDGKSLRPTYQANMDRLREYRGEVRRLSSWSACLTERLESGKEFSASCLRTDQSIPEGSLLNQPLNPEIIP